MTYTLFSSKFDCHNKEFSLIFHLFRNGGSKYNMKTLDFKSTFSQVELINEKLWTLVKKGEFRKFANQLSKETEEEIIKEIFSWFTKIFLSTHNSQEKLVARPLLTTQSEWQLGREFLWLYVYAFQILDYFSYLPQNHNQMIEKLKLLNQSSDSGEIKKTEDLFDSLKNINNFFFSDKELFDNISKKILNHLDYVPQNKTKTENRFWKESVFLLLGYAQTLFRKNDLEETKKILFKLKTFVETNLATESSPSYSTKANVYSELAKVFRKTGDIFKAERFYYQAADNFLKKALNPKFETNEYKELNLQFQARRVAQLYLFGIYRINSMKSDITHAESNLLVSKLLLQFSKDEVGEQYEKLALAIISRIKAGNDPNKLKVAANNLEEARNGFILLGHQRFVAKSSFELAIVNYLLNDNDRAELFLKEAEVSNDPNELHKTTNFQILQSHIERSRGQLRTSFNLGLEALNASYKSGNKIARIDAHLAVAESAFMLEVNTGMSVTNETSEKHFQAALDLIQEKDNFLNPKLLGIAYLGLSKSYALVGFEAKAQHFFQEYTKISHLIEHRFVHEVLEQNTRNYLERLIDNFVIPADSDLDYFENLKALKKWLYHKAHKRSLKKQDVADTLGVSRQTLLDWEKEFTKSKQKVSAKNRKKVE